ncbi:hypothetical protein CVT26_013162, partial [Gymnopilus dilepis]
EDEDQDEDDQDEDEDEEEEEDDEDDSDVIDDDAGDEDYRDDDDDDDVSPVAAGKKRSVSDIEDSDSENAEVICLKKGKKPRLSGMKKIVRKMKGKGSSSTRIVTWRPEVTVTVEDSESDDHLPSIQPYPQAARPPSPMPSHISATPLSSPVRRLVSLFPDSPSVAGPSSAAFQDAAPVAGPSSAAVTTAPSADVLEDNLSDGELSDALSDLSYVSSPAHSDASSTAHMFIDYTASELNDIDEIMRQL